MAPKSYIIEMKIHIYAALFEKLPRPGWLEHKWMGQSTKLWIVSHHNMLNTGLTLQK